MTLLERRGPENRVKFTYVKAHVGIDGNEAADVSLKTQVQSRLSVEAFRCLLRDWLATDPPSSQSQRAGTGSPSTISLGLGKNESGSSFMGQRRKAMLTVELGRRTRLRQTSNSKYVTKVDGKLCCADRSVQIDPDWLLSEAELAKLDETQDF